MRAAPPCRGSRGGSGPSSQTTMIRPSVPNAGEDWILGTSRATKSSNWRTGSFVPDTSWPFSQSLGDDHVEAGDVSTRQGRVEEAHVVGAIASRGQDFLATLQRGHDVF